MTTEHSVTMNEQQWELTALSPVLGDLTIPLTTSLNASLSIGRHTDNDVVLAVPQISRRHAKFNQVGQHLYLQDLNSANGTFVNGQKIAGEAVAVSPDDEIGFADLLFVLSLNKPFSASVIDAEITETIVENPTFAKEAISSPTQSTETPTMIAKTVALEKIATEPVTLPPQVVEAVTVTPTANPVRDTPVTVPTVTPTITAPVEPQTISPMTTTASPESADNQHVTKNPASKNMWLIAIVMILLIAGLVIAKMVL